MSTEVTYRPDPADGLPAMRVNVWARRKHHYLDRYLDIFAGGMKNKWSRRVYIDLFAGPGRCVLEGTEEFVDGSPLIALRHPFTDHIYVDLEPSNTSALKTRCALAAKERFVTVIQGNCNEVVDQIVARIPRYSLACAFIDPTNWQITFETVRRLSGVGRVDLLISFFGGMMKRVDHFADQPRLDAFFGSHSWKDDPRYRTVEGRPSLGGYLACYRGQLETIGYQGQLSAREIPVKNSKGATMYLLTFASKHPLGYTFWDKITTEDERGQLAVPW